MAAQLASMLGGDGARCAAYMTLNDFADRSGVVGAMDVLQLMFFAGLAVFLGVKLYTTLGKPTGRSPEEHAREDAERRAARPEPVQNAPRPIPVSEAFAGPAGEGLLAIAQADRSFDPDEFLSGAKQAYSMIVLAYANGDKESLGNLLTKRVLTAYEASISARERAGHTVTTEIERVAKAAIVEASLNDNQARVRVAFTAEIATETKDQKGQRVEGDLNVLKTVDEVWSFERDIDSENPNWRLSGVKTTT